MSIRATGAGTGSVVLDRRPTYIAFRLGNFDIEGDKMKAEHILFIEHRDSSMDANSEIYRGFVSWAYSLAGPAHSVMTLRLVNGVLVK